MKDIVNFSYTVCPLSLIPDRGGVNRFKDVELSVNDVKF